MDKIMYFSRSRLGFYDPKINTQIPDDAVEISVEQWRAILSELSAGKVLAVADGLPVAVEPQVVEPEPEALRAGAMARFIAHIEDYMRPFTADFADMEPHAWSKKEEAARAYPNGRVDQNAMIEVESSINDETPQALCAKIIAEADLKSALVAVVTGMRRKARSAIQAADPADIDIVAEAMCAEFEARIVQVVQDHAAAQA